MMANVLDHEATALVADVIQIDDNTIINLDSDRTWAKLLSVDCPLCLADAGNHCAARSDDCGLIHEVRIFEARKMWHGPIFYKRA
jgi:hypothetical protein